MEIPKKNTKKKENAWKIRETELKIHAQNLSKSIIYSAKIRETEIQYFYCDDVIRFIDFLHKNTKSRELGFQHHAFKILFKYMIYGEKGILEYNRMGKRADIYLPESDYEIEVKTMSDFTIEKLLDKTMAIKESEYTTADAIWFFFFLKIASMAPDQEMCKSLLVFVNIKSMEQDKKQLRRDLIMLIEDSKKQVAKKLKISPTLLIPVENIITVEDMEEKIKEKDQKLLEKDQKLLEKDQKLLEKDQKLLEKDQEILEKDKLIEKQKKEIEQLRNELKKK